jgi:hypothetical protein
MALLAIISRPSYVCTFRYGCCVTKRGESKRLALTDEKPNGIGGRLEEFLHSHLNALHSNPRLKFQFS